MCMLFVKIIESYEYRLSFLCCPHIFNVPCWCWIRLFRLWRPSSYKKYFCSWFIAYCLVIVMYLLLCNAMFRCYTILQSKMMLKCKFLLECQTCYICYVTVINIGYYVASLCYFVILLSIAGVDWNENWRSVMTDSIVQRALPRQKNRPSSDLKTIDTKNKTQKKVKRNPLTIVIHFLLDLI